MSDDNLMQMLPGTARTFVQTGDNRWALFVEQVLADPMLRRRLIRTQIEELLALDAWYPLPELAAVRELLSQMRSNYSDVEPFARTLAADLLPEEDDELAEHELAVRRTLRSGRLAGLRAERRPTP